MPHRRLAAAIARMKARGPPALDSMDEEEKLTPAGMLQDLSLRDPPSDAAREDDVVEEEKYVKAMLNRSLDIFRRVKASGISIYREGWTLLEKELVLEMEYTNWAVLSDGTITALCAYLLDLLVYIENDYVEEEAGPAGGGAAAAAAAAAKIPGLGKLREGAPPESLDCAFAALDVLEKMMEARFINFEGEDLERPFDREGSLSIYRALVSALRLIVAVINYEGYNPAPHKVREEEEEEEEKKEEEEEEKKRVKRSTSSNSSSNNNNNNNNNNSNSRRPPTVPTNNGSSSVNGLGKTFTRPASLSSSALVIHGTHPSLSSPRNALAPKTFTFDDAAGKEQVHTKTKTYEPLQYLLTVFHLLSHSSIQTDATAFWDSPDVVIEELWAPRNLQALLACIGIVLDKLHHSPDARDQALLTILVDRWIHTLHGLICTDSIGRQMSATVPEEDKARDLDNDKPGIECLTGVSTYLGMWMDVRCLPCSCMFCGVQRESMECMMSKWDRRLAHRLIQLGGVGVIGRVAFWLLESFRSMEVSGDCTGEDLYRTDVALATQVVHLSVLSDYQVATLAEAPTLRAQAVKQAIDSGFLNFLLAYFIPRKLCRLEDRQCETTEDQNKARRLARISCKNCIEFLLLSGDGWITDTCYNARGVVKIGREINHRMAPAAQRLVELWAEDKRVCGTTEELLEHYSPFFLKLCEIIRLSARYGCMKDIWSQELLDACVNVLATYTHLAVSHYSSPSSPSSCDTSFLSPPSSPSSSTLSLSLPPKKALLCAMATFTDMCSPFFGGRDHYSSASRAVHDCAVLKRVLDIAKSSKAATSCIRALSYVSRVELVVSVSTMKNCTNRALHTHDGTTLHHHHLSGQLQQCQLQELQQQQQRQQQSQQHQMLMRVCHQCHRPPTLPRPLRQCGRCKRVFYCCVECQRANWREHEKKCVPFGSQGGGEGGRGVKRGEDMTERGEGEGGGGAGATAHEGGSGGSSATVTARGMAGSRGGEGGGGRGGGGATGGGKMEVMSTGTGTFAGVGAGASATRCSQCAAKAQGGRQLMTCGRCREAFYCSKECQTKHWVLHRQLCGPDPLALVVESGEEERRR